jgi:hypothetical protein
MAPYYSFDRSLDISVSSSAPYYPHRRGWLQGFWFQRIRWSFTLPGYCVPEIFRLPYHPIGSVILHTRLLPGYPCLMDEIRCIIISVFNGLSATRLLIWYARIFLCALLSPKSKLAPRLLAAESQLVIYTAVQPKECVSETLHLRMRAQFLSRQPHAAFDVAGAGNGAWSRSCDTRRRKGEQTGNTNFDLNHRVSSRPYQRLAETG